MYVTHKARQSHHHEQQRQQKKPAATAGTLTVTEREDVTSKWEERESERHLLLRRQLVGPRPSLDGLVVVRPESRVRGPSQQLVDEERTEEVASGDRRRSGGGGDGPRPLVALLSSVIHEGV